MKTEEDEATGENGERLSTRQHLVDGDKDDGTHEGDGSEENSQDEEKENQAGQLQQHD